MTVKLLLLIGWATVSNCQSTISSRNDAACTCERGQFEDMRSEMESNHQTLIELKKSAARSETHTMLLKSEIEGLRRLMAEQQYWSRNECPPGFDYLPEVGSCYKLISERMNWDDATKKCRQMMPGAHLAAITSQAENNAIARYLQSQFSRSSLGGNNRCAQAGDNWPESGNLIWLSGQTKDPLRCVPYVWRPLEGIEIPLNYSNWNRLYPDCYKGMENCLQIATGLDYTWNDYNCTSSSCAICELHV